jgi:glutamyl-tRNA reductase
MREKPFYFPLFVSLEGKRVVIVGGGQVARRRVEALRPFGPEITVISPQLLGEPEGICWHRRPYQAGDLAGAFLAVAATNDRAVNQQVGQEARALGIPVSVADRQEECTFYFPALCMGEGVIAGVVSRGEDHRQTAKTARSIRAFLEEEDETTHREPGQCSGHPTE